MSFDSHAHLDLASAGNSLQWKALLDRAYCAGIRCILVPAVHPDRWNNLLDLVCAAYQPGITPRLFVAIGIHPCALHSLPHDEASAALERLETLLLSKERPTPIVAVGETGLDYRTQYADRAWQRRVFREHLRLSRLTGLPLVIHCVRAYGELLRELQACPPPPSIIHGFTGKAQLARQLCDMGHAIGVGGMITNPQAKHLKEAILQIPREQLLLETDTPDQTPWHRRPAPNEPSFLPEIAQAAAAILGVPHQELLEQCADNAARYLRISDDERNRLS